MSFLNHFNSSTFFFIHNSTKDIRIHLFFFLSSDCKIHKYTN
uniref:Uncharacterized protein n=1 Tax=Siphoviridae sp. ctedO8 TaxID=2827907 RepID=A0A8S5T2X5_9CAUD|nr:MAG TPA: hypothetical protein [Siphoviridae sp. ctedO8]